MYLKILPQRRFICRSRDWFWNSVISLRLWTGQGVSIDTVRCWGTRNYYPILLFLYSIKAWMSCPYPGDSKYLVPGQKSHAPFWQWQWDKGFYPAKAATPTLGHWSFAWLQMCLHQSITLFIQKTNIGIFYKIISWPWRGHLVCIT